MSGPRLSARFWVDAWRLRAEAAGIAVYLLHRGDDRAGAVVVKSATRDGRARAFQRVLTGEGRRWETLAEGAEGEVDAAIARARSRDPDLWVLEAEDRQGRTLLDEAGLAD